MKRLKIATAALAIFLPLLSCTSYNAYQKAQSAETMENWDEAIIGWLADGGAYTAKNIREELADVFVRRDGDSRGSAAV